MDIFSFITLVGGLAFFLYGMNVLSSSLERMTGGTLEKALKSMTSNRFRGFLLGAGVTAAIQSSSAVTVMLVGFVNSGIMTIKQSIGVIMGSNVGTTITAWILSLVGIESENPFMKLLKPTIFSLIFAFVGILLIMLSKSSKKKDIGTILIGFAVLMFGMDLMSDAVSPLAESESFSKILTAFNNPFLGVIVGAIFTAVIQSSSASVGILQSLAGTGTVSFGMAIPIIMGQNIGTCITSLISSIGVNRNAKKVAVIHISFNLIGSVICLAVFYGLNAIIDFAFVDTSINEAGIAVVHSLFNIFTTIILFPFTNLLEKIANIVLKDNKGEVEEKTKLLDERLLATPTVAIAECDSVTCKMAEYAKETILEAMKSMDEYSNDKFSKIEDRETFLDRYEDKIGTYLVKVSSQKISEEDSQRVSLMLHAIGDFERLGDHALNLMKVARELKEKNYSFSEKAMEEIGVLKKAIEEILTFTIDAFIKDDVKAAAMVEPFEQVVDDLVAAIKIKHIKRLQSGNCSIEMGFILSDLLNSYERISDRCSNVAVAMIELDRNAFATHKYLDNVKYSNKNFNEIYAKYSEKYSI